MFNLTHKTLTKGELVEARKSLHRELDVLLDSMTFEQDNERSLTTIGCRYTLQHDGVKRLIVEIAGQ